MDYVRTYSYVCRSTDAGALDASQTVQYMFLLDKLAHRLDHVKVPARAYRT